jgi:hypothetical protein
MAFAQRRALVPAKAQASVRRRSVAKRVTEETMPRG